MNLSSDHFMISQQRRHSRWFNLSASTPSIAATKLFVNVQDPTYAEAAVTLVWFTTKPASFTGRDAWSH
jgi:hypothetical protein